VSGSRPGIGHPSSAIRPLTFVIGVPFLSSIGRPTLADPSIAVLDATQNVTIEASPANAWDDYPTLTKSGDGTLTLAEVGGLGVTLPMLAVGARGVVSVAGNIVPRDVLAMWTAFESGNIAEARRWHAKLFPLCRDMLGLSTNPIPIKAAMKILGRDTGELRLPMTPLEAAGEAKLRKTLSAYGLL
jgi:4-hydroxy-tetrahydrodipicolinate synthase